MTDHVSAKHFLLTLTRAELERLILRAPLSPKEREIMRLHYIDKRSLGFIADVIGYAYSTVRLKHRQAVEIVAREIEKDGQG